MFVRHAGRSILIGPGARASEMLGDRAQFHKLPRGPRRHLGPLSDHGEQDRPGIVVGVEVDPVGTTLDGLQQWIRRVSPQGRRG